jgi:hypothetical protein
MKNKNHFTSHKCYFLWSTKIFLNLINILCRVKHLKKKLNKKLLKKYIYILHQNK